MDRDSKHGEEDCQLKENGVHEDAGGLIVQNSNQALKEQRKIRDFYQGERPRQVRKKIQLGTVETISGSEGSFKRFLFDLLILSYQHDGGGDDDEGSDETGNGKVHRLPPPGHVILRLCRRCPVSKIHAPGPKPAQVRQGGLVVSI